MGKNALKAISGFGDMESGIMFVGKKIRQVSSKAEIRRPESPVCVKPKFCFGINGFLLEKFTPLLIPVIQSRGKLGFVA